MPEAVEPSGPESTEIDNTVNLKVYKALSIADINNDDWELDNLLICTGLSQSKNSQVGSASFSLLPFDNDTTREGYEEELQATKGAAQDTLKVNLTNYQDPYYVKVTDVIDGVIAPVFYGYINSVTNDIANARCSASALSYAGLLDQVDLCGAWWKSLAGAAEWFFEIEPIFNPRGLGNRSGTTVSGGGVTGPIIEEVNILNGELNTQRFTALDMINLVLLHATRSDAKLNDGIFTPNPWSFAASIYKTGIIEIEPAAQAALNDSFAVDNYTYYGKTMWAALVELVESVDNLMITERISYDAGEFEKPRIYITKGGT